MTLTCSSMPRALALLAVTLLVSACSSSTPAPATKTAESTPVQPPALVLWGDMKPVVSVKELMKFMIDPIADNIFDAVGTIVTKNGVVDRVPKTDEEWDKVQTGGVSIAEGAYLLKVPRDFTPAGDHNNSEGPDAVELSPEAIKAKVLQDPVEWNARIETLRNAGLAVIDIAKKRDAAAMWDASENLDTACENCHRSYWYPGENAEFYKKLRSRLDDYTQKHSVGTLAPPQQKK
jgi:cytochrome c556